MIKNFVELDKSLTTPVDAAGSWGAIDIRLVVASKKPEEGEAPGDAAEDLEGDISFDGTGPLDSYLEKPKGKGYIVFLVNGQRHDSLDESFVGRELGFKYLRSRTMIVVDADKLAPEAIAQIVQGSRQGFYKGEVYSAILNRLVSVLKGDPDLKRLESDAEQEVSELKSGDAAVKSKLDQLIEGHHAASTHELQQPSGPQGGTSGTAVATVMTFVVQADSSVGEPATGPVLITDPASSSIRLHPGEAKTIRISANPPHSWEAVTYFRHQIEPAIPELALTESLVENGRELRLLFSEPDDFPAEDYPLILKLSCVAEFKNHPDARLVDREIIISQKNPRQPRPRPTLRPIPTFLRVVSRQPVQLHLGGPATHVRMRWDGDDELVTAHPPLWRFHARCTTVPSYPAPVFTMPYNGRFEVVLDVPDGLTLGKELTFQIEAIGPSGELLATPFKGIVAEPIEKPEARRVAESSASSGTLRRPPYELKIITESEWSSQTCWGQTEWTAEEAGSYNEPTQSSPLVLIVNQDIELLKAARDAMLKRKLDERTIHNRMNGYTARIAYHLWQMYLQTQELAVEQASDEDVHLPSNDQLRAEINRVASTLINLMEP